MTDLKEAFKQAAEIAQQVPETMQAAAFERALDLLVGTSRGKRSRRTKTKKQSSLDASPLGSKPERSDNGEPRRGKALGTGLQPKAAILWLIEIGFLDSGKTLPAMQEHLKKKRAYDLPTNQLGMALLRLVRDGKLERDENRDGQYEYKIPKS